VHVDSTEPAQRDAVAVRRFIERFASLLNESGLPPISPTGSG
jgi:hypothetical protein